MDNTPPRNRLIALYTALAVVTLLGLKPAFDAYFDRMHISALAEGIQQGFVEATVAGEPAAEARRATASALEGQEDALRRCFDERLAEVPGLAGGIEARVRNQNGVVSVQLDEGGIEDQELRECVRSALEGLAGLPPTEMALRLAFAPTEADAIKLGWRDALASGPMPIADAMARIGAQGRLADPRIRPQRSGEMNLDPLRGWAQRPLELPRSVQQAQQPAAPAPAPEGAAPEGAPAPEGAAPEGAAPEAAAPEAAPAPAPEAAPAPVRPRPARPSPAPAPAPEPEATE